MVIADLSDFIGIAVVLWVVLMLVAIVAGWFKPRSKHRASAGKHQPIEVEYQPIEVDHKPIEVDHQVIEVEHQAAMRDFGAIERTGDELRNGWYEHIFVLEKPVAGVDEVWTLHGFARFTTANRCIVITDGQRLVILDRQKDHGVRLVISTAHWFDASVEEKTVVLSCYNDMEVANSYNALLLRRIQIATGYLFLRGGLGGTLYFRSPEYLTEKTRVLDGVAKTHRLNATLASTTTTSTTRASSILPLQSEIWCGLGPS